MVRRVIVGLVLSMLLAACGSPTPTVTPPPPTPISSAPIPSGSYRPLQKGDLVEGQSIDYAYILPSADNPVIEVALGINILNLVSINPQMTDSLVAFAHDVAQQSHTIFAFDENQPNQVYPAQLMIAANKPIEFVVIKLPDDARNWSVRETQNNEVRAGYKLVRRADGGLRYILAYDLTALNNFVTFLPAGRGGGLILSSRLAVLNLVLSDQRYQRGENVMETFPPDIKAYDARVLKTDPAKEGLDQNVDWAIITRPGPNPGITLPQ